MPLTIDRRGMAVDSHILIIGAGLAGLGMGAQLKRLLCHNNFTIYDKYDDVGGTWAQNTYPNLSCDVPSEYYSFSFFQNPDWSEKFASQPEILAYLHDYVRHFALEPHLRLRMECLSLRWSSNLSQWTALFKDLDKSHEFELHSKYVITAMGVLDIPKGLDDLPLLAGFGGADDYWHERGGSEAYMGVSVSKFPNLFLLAGPNTLPSSNSTLRGIECSIVYITRVLRGLWARNPSQQSQARLEIAPSPSAQAMFNAELQRKMRALVYTQQVNTWYIGKDSGKNTLIWPGTQISFWFSRCVRPVKWSDWVISR